MPRAWFAYNGFSSITAVGSYIHIAASELDCPGFGTICAIYAYYSPGSGSIPTHPDSPFTSGILSYLTSSLVGQTDLPQGANKKYLYVKEG